MPMIRQRSFLDEGRALAILSYFPWRRVRMRTRQKRSIDVSPQASAAVDRPSLKLRKLGALLVTADTAVLALTGLDRPIQTALTAGSPGWPIALTTSILMVSTNLT